MGRAAPANACEFIHQVTSLQNERLLLAVDSTDRCNTFVEHLGRGSVPQGLPGSLIQFSRNRIQLFLRVARDVDALGQVLSE